MSKINKKFNWVDIVIILIIISMFGLILNRNKIFSSDNVSKIITGKNEIILTAKANSVPIEVVNSFKVGDKVVGNSKVLDGEIIDVQYQPAKIIEVRGDKPELVQSKSLYDLYVTSRVSATIYNSYMEIENQEVKVGLGFYIAAEKATVYGTIVSIEEVNAKNIENTNTANNA